MKLHLGCGSIHLPGWINIDMEAPEADMHLDLRNPLPFESASVDCVYSEHFIEHVDRDEAVKLLKEVQRVLKPGGVIRLVTPDLRFLCCTYLAGNLDEWGYSWRPASGARMINEGMRLWGHQFVYDTEELDALLHEGGFTERTYQNWRTSAYSELSGLETRPYHRDLIIEGRKPLADEGIDPHTPTAIAAMIWHERLQERERAYAHSLTTELTRQAARIRLLEEQLAQAGHLTAR